MFKQILSDLYSRVVVAYKPTLIGIGIAAADVIVQAFLGSSNGIVHGLAAVAAAALALYRGKVPAPPSPVDVV